MRQASIFGARARPWERHPVEGTWTGSEFEAGPKAYLMPMSAPGEKHDTAPDSHCGHILPFLFLQVARREWNRPVDHRLIDLLDRLPTRSPADREAAKKLLVENWGKDLAILNKLRFYEECATLCYRVRHFFDYAVWMALESLKSSGTDVVSLDASPFELLNCFAANHDHTSGYGPYVNPRTHDCCAEILKQHPSAVLAGESGADFVLDVLHHAYFKDGVHPAYAVPLFAKIYQGYTVHSGWNWNDPTGGGTAWENPEDFTAGQRLPDHAVTAPPPRKVKGSTRIGQPTFTLGLSPIEASGWVRNRDKTMGLLLLSNSSPQRQSRVVAGHKVDLESYSWQGAEFTVK